MNTETKTLGGWREFSDRTGKGSIYEYLRKGDVVSEDLVGSLMGALPPKETPYGYLQAREPYSHAYDIDHSLRPTYMTFARCDGQWRFYGNCFAWETVDRTYY